MQHALCPCSHVGVRLELELKVGIERNGRFWITHIVCFMRALSKNITLRANLGTLFSTLDIVRKVACTKYPTTRDYLESHF
jgi:hypothetical protein